MKRIFLFTIIMIWAIAASAQSGAARGTILDASTHEGIPFANIVLMGVDDTLFLRGCSANEDGHFEFPSIPKGRYKLRASSVGYQLFDTTFIHSSNTQQINVMLSIGVMLKEVTILTTKPLFSSDGEKNIYNTTDDPSIQSGTAVDALQNAPGIEVDADGNITLRGTQEVSIWINNRESKMNAEALKQYIKSLPANAIQRIEVITNPSARYGGGRPVVNIIMHHKTLSNQFVSIGTNANTRPEIDPWISYIFNNEKWEADIYASLGYTHNSTQTTGTNHLITNDRETARTDHYSTLLDEKGVSPLLSADLAYHPDSLNTVALWLGAFPQWSGLSSTTDCQRLIYCYSPGDHSFTEQRHKQLLGTPSAGLYDGIWLEHVFDANSGHSLSGGYFGGLWTSDSVTDITRHYTSARPNWVLKEQHATKEWMHGVEVNYVRPWGRQDTTTGLFTNEMEVGLEGEYASRWMATRMDTLESDGNYSSCHWLSHLANKCQLNSDLYASYTRRWNSLSAKAGLSSSLINGTMSYPDAPSYNYAINHWLWTPSVHITYTTDNQHTFSLGYTCRSSAPDTKNYTRYRLLRIDDYATGNPQLSTGLSHRLEAKWNKYYDNFGSIELNAYHLAQKNKLGELTDVIYDGTYYQSIITYTHPINIGDASTTGMDLNLSYRPNAFVNVRLNASLFYDYLLVQYRPDETAIGNGMLCYSARLNAWVKLWQQLQLFTNIYYKSPTQGILSTQFEHKGVDLGMNADLFKNLLSINLNINDLFNWNSWDSESTNPYLSSAKATKNISRYISLGLTLRIGELGLEHRPGRRHHGKAREDAEE